MIDRSCCEGGRGGQPEPQDCVEKWEEELKKVTNDYNKYVAKTTKTKEEYDNSQSWEAKLKHWDEIIKKADEKAKLIVQALQFFLEQIETVCENSTCTTEALEKLICLVKSIFDCLYTYDQNKEGLIDMVKNFKKLIECLKKVDEEDKAEAIKCIEAYEQKIIQVYEMQDAILSKLLETLTCANLLESYICNDKAGLKYKVKGVLIDFKGEEEEDEDHCNDDDDDNGDNGSPDLYPCDDKKAKPKPRFPIHESDYYKEIEEALEKAKEKTGELEKEWIDNKKKSDCILSNKNSLVEAIKAAKEAESGK